MAVSRDSLSYMGVMPKNIFIWHACEKDIETSKLKSVEYRDAIKKQGDKIGMT